MTEAGRARDAMGSLSPHQARAHRQVATLTAPAERLHCAGLKATQQRLDVLDALSMLEHPTADVLWTALGRTTMAVTTVYRTLQALEHAGIVTSARLGTGQAVYHRADQAPHDHLLCTHCGGFHDAELAVAVPAPHVRANEDGQTFHVERVLVVAIGTCGDCQERGRHQQDRSTAL